MVNHNELSHSRNTVRGFQLFVTFVSVAEYMTLNGSSVTLTTVVLLTVVEFTVSVHRQVGAGVAV